MGPPLPAVQCGTSLMPHIPRSPIQIEIFLDLICPFSAKMFFTLYRNVLPQLKDANDINLIVHQVIQPWHPQGTMVHECALAVKNTYPELYADCIDAIFTAFIENGDFKDDKTWEKSRAQIYDDLLFLLNEKLPSIEIAKIKKLLIPTLGNSGNAMTQQVKWACKYHRTKGVHVTPTVYVNGLEAGVVSSGWTVDQWMSFLEQKGQDNFTGP